MIVLSLEDRDRFAGWLEQEARSDEQMAEQVMKLPTGETLEPMAHKLRVEAMAARVIALKLRSIETVEITNGG